MTPPEALGKLLELVENKEEDSVFASTIENLKETYFVNASNNCLKANQVLKDLTRNAAKLQIWELTIIPPKEEIAYFQSTPQRCDCKHHWSYELPCRHMYQCRRELGKYPLY